MLDLVYQNGPIMEPVQSPVDQDFEPGPENAWDQYRLVQVISLRVYLVMLEHVGHHGLNLAHVL